MVKSRKHTLITISKKLEIIELIDKGGCKKAIAQEFGIATSTVFQIYQKREKLKKYSESLCNSESLQQMTAMHQLSYSPSLESRLQAWHDSLSQKNVSVTGEMILSKARELQKTLEDEEGKTYNFKFTASFVNSFKKKLGSGKTFNCPEKSQNNYEVTETSETLVKNEDCGLESGRNSEISHDDGLEALRIFAEYSKQHAGFGTITLELLNHLKGMTEMIKTNQVKLLQFESILSKK